MLRVQRVLSFAERVDPHGQIEPDAQAAPSTPLNARRGGFIHGTKISTDHGWKLVEQVQPGDLVRTLDNGFQKVSRVSTDAVSVAVDETNPENMPIRVPSQAAFNGRPVWLMPEQGIALDNSRIGERTDRMPVLPARSLNGLFRLSPDAPAIVFEVSSLFFEQDQLIYIEGGLRAFCPAGRFGARGVPADATYQVTNGERAADLVAMAARTRDISILAHSLGSLPAQIFENPIMPARPVRGLRRPGRPGRPTALI